MSTHPYKGSKAADVGKSRAKAFTAGGYARGGRAKKGGKTEINIAIIGGEPKKDEMEIPGGAGPAMPPMMPPPGPMAGPAGGPPGMPGMPPKPPGMMNRGGKVPMKGGADSGVGRLDKVKAYKKG